MAKLTLKVKKRTIKDDANLFAKELNLNPEDYRAVKIIDIALKTIKSSDNPLVMERIRSIKSNIKNAMQDFKPYIDQAKKDKPGIDTLVKFREILNSDNFDYNVQELLKEIEKEIKQSRVKESTKPSGQAPSNSKRNERIRKEYYILKEKGRSQKEAYNILASKYKLKPSTIETYIKK